MTNNMTKERVQVITNTSINYSISNISIENLSTLSRITLYNQYEKIKFTIKDNGTISITLNSKCNFYFPRYATNQELKQYTILLLEVMKQLGFHSVLEILKNKTASERFQFFLRFYD